MLALHGTTRANPSLMMKNLLPLLILVAPAVFSQQSTAKDSLSRLIKTSAEDSLRVDLYYAYGDLYEGREDDSALFYYAKARKLAQKINYTRGEARYAGQSISILNNRGQFREALALAKEALELYKKSGSPKELAAAYLNVGSEWQYVSDFDAAAENYMESKKYAEQIKDPGMLKKSYNNLASVYLSLGRFEKGRDYAQQGLNYARQLKNEVAVSSALFNLATAHSYLKHYDTALVVFNEIEAIAQKLNDEIIFLDAWLGKAGAYSGLDNAAEALVYYNRIIQLSQKKEFPEYEMYAYMGVADLQLKTKHYKAADEAIQKGLALARKLETTYELKDLLLKASGLNEKTGNYTLALDYYKQAHILNDSIIGERNQVTVANNEARYEFEKKQMAIDNLTEEKELQQLKLRQQGMINYMLIAGTVAVILLAFLIYRNFRREQKFHRQRINELETEKKLTATEAIIKGEEQERSRLAKDLHDGLGGMLSGVKHSLSSIKENLVMTEQNMSAFEHSLIMLDSSISEMRRVAHNMMPESLLKFGLDLALNDFCRQVTTSGSLKVSYQSIEIADTPIEQSLAITVYRIVQELLNNSIKHASAKHAIVQLALEGRQLLVTVEDDGKGMDRDLLKSAKGIGWKNISSRLDYHNGKLDIQSSPDKGTSVYIEFMI